MSMPGFLSVVIHDFIRPTTKTKRFFKREMKRRKAAKILYDFAGVLCAKYNADQKKFGNLCSNHINPYDDIMYSTHLQNWDGHTRAYKQEMSLRISRSIPYFVMTRHYIGNELFLKLSDPIFRQDEYLSLTRNPDYDSMKQKAARQCELFNNRSDTDPPEIINLRAGYLALYKVPTIMTYTIKRLIVTLVLTNPETAQQWKIELFDNLSQRLITCRWLHVHHHTPTLKLKPLNITTCGCGSHILSNSMKAHRKSKKHLKWIDT